eukprot:CAMPEP_0176161250 /NCGR_PEP_ID=MMETSP0120_2-20121206/82497_1 /TAXON_ID=160619 /ORGANISM="Kryptoperidinium foliaceum, Strain CCMP 1326" /LENGTH=545 /DNA_ID=CAMNT_0017498727 /DNA_START=58 /DNA_END=1695 /DNA_ORIENTATION=-
MAEDSSASQAWRRSSLFAPSGGMESTPEDLRVATFQASTDGLPEHAGNAQRSLPPLHPAPPQNARQFPVRPQSNRFLKETLVKLSDDSVRVGKRLIGPELDQNPASPSLRTQTPLSLPEQAGYIPAWEASLRSTPSPFVGPTSASDMTLAACERAAASAAATASAAPPYAVRDAMLAVANVISHWERNTSKAAETWAHHMDQQSERHEFSNDRWDAFHAQLSTMAEQLERLDQQVARRVSTAEVFEAEQRNANSRIELLVEGLSRDIAAAARASSEQAAASLQGTAEQAAAVRSLSEQLEGLRKELAALTTAATEDAAHWYTNADRWHKEQQDALVALEAARRATSDSEAQVERVQRDVDELRSALAEATKALAEMKTAPASQALSKVQEVEKRGRVRLDRKSGQVEVLSGGLDFVVPKTPGAEPLATFKDAALAEQAITDIAELWKLFDGPLDLEMHFRAGKGGNLAWWNSQATTQVACLKEKLGEAGIDTLMISAAVSQGPDTSARITFKRDVFDSSAAAATAPAAAEKKGDRRAPARSPRRP